MRRIFHLPNSISSSAPPPLLDRLAKFKVYIYRSHLLPDQKSRRRRGRGKWQILQLLHELLLRVQLGMMRGSRARGRSPPHRTKIPDVTVRKTENEKVDVHEWACKGAKEQARVGAGASRGQLGVRQWSRKPCSVPGLSHASSRETTTLNCFFCLFSIAHVYVQMIRRASTSALSRVGLYLLIIINPCPTRETENLTFLVFFVSSFLHIASGRKRKTQKRSIAS
jgi:hypothetical protein